MRIIERIRRKLERDGRAYVGRHYPGAIDAELRLEMLLSAFMDSRGGPDSSLEAGPVPCEVCHSSKERVRKLAGENQRINAELNALGDLYQELNSRFERVRRYADAEVDDFGLEPHQKIVLVGDCRVHNNHIVGMAKAAGLDAQKLELHAEYDPFNELCIQSLAASPNVGGVLLGPVPHKVRGCPSEPLRFLKESGKPVVPVLDASGKLKASKQSFKRALGALKAEIASRRWENELQAG